MLASFASALKWNKGGSGDKDYKLEILRVNMDNEERRMKVNMLRHYLFELLDGYREGTRMGNDNGHEAKVSPELFEGLNGNGDMAGFDNCRESRGFKLQSVYINGVSGRMIFSDEQRFYFVNLEPPCDLESKNPKARIKINSRPIPNLTGVRFD
jgi:hypothetical protein